jgi:hypothetical protein
MSQPPDDGARCVVCGKPQVARFRPFCSKRCANVDLAKWLRGGYAIPAEEPPDTGLDGPEDEE